MDDFQTFRDSLSGLGDELVSLSGTCSEVVARVTAALAPHEMDVAEPQASLAGSLRKAFVGDLPLVSLRYGAEVIVRPAPAAGLIMLQIVLSGSTKIEHDGNTTFGRAGQGLIIESLDYRTLYWSSDCEQLIIPLRRSIIAQAIEMMTGLPAPARFDFDRIVDLASPSGKALMNLVEYVISLSVPQMDTASPTGSIAIQLLAHHILNKHRKSHLREPQTSVAPAHVIRAERFMRTNIAEKLNLQIISDHANVSVRTLSSSFRRFRGVSPMEWLRNYRLDVVRMWLQNGQARTVASAAASAGFMHTGRFSQIYRYRFGESPSETLSAPHH